MSGTGIALVLFFMPLCLYVFMSDCFTVMYIKLCLASNSSIACSRNNISSFRIIFTC